MGSDRCETGYLYPDADDDDADADDADADDADDDDTVRRLRW